MSQQFLPSLDNRLLQEAINASNPQLLYQLLVEPLHEALYHRQSFDFMDELTEGQQLLLSYDYLWQQVGQGGFIQLLANGYVGLLPDMPRWLQQVAAPEMALIIDDVTKVYVLNIHLFTLEMSTQQFAKLYDELKEFETLDARFQQYHDATVAAIVSYAKTHLQEFVDAAGS